MMEKFKRFMYGRYGVDLVSLAVLVVGLVLSTFGQWFNLIILTLFSYALYIYGLFRIFSKNIPARQRELTILMKYKSKVRGWFSFKKKQVEERKLYKYFGCPNCKQKLRAPRGRGKIQVTCQKCKTTFIKKT
ncbi:hypothetical protein [Scatolibacter rhodanostii]|uniref:hypothetical protein n=1 Tax=Scatolibacter rhodanostii TaxID=2014781 RepID=UPI000C081C4C|nr:hypothetical protein [Scatolibacter rhodanostii]